MSVSLARNARPLILRAADIRPGHTVTNVPGHPGVWRVLTTYTVTGVRTTALLVDPDDTDADVSRRAVTLAHDTRIGVVQRLTPAPTSAVSAAVLTEYANAFCGLCGTYHDGGRGACLTNLDEQI